MAAGLVLSTAVVRSLGIIVDNDVPMRSRDGILILPHSVSTTAHPTKFDVVNNSSVA